MPKWAFNLEQPSLSLTMQSLAEFGPSISDSHFCRTNRYRYFLQHLNSPTAKE